MKRFLGNLLIRLLLNANAKYKINLINSLSGQEYIFRKKTYFDKYNISSDFKINGRNTMLYGEGEIKIGLNSYIGNYSSIQAVENYSVKIGDNCSISHNVRIYTSTYDSDAYGNTKFKQKVKYGNVIIGSGVWIGANVLICPNVQIGDNVVVGANSVVVKNLKANTVNSGVPCKVIRDKC